MTWVFGICQVKNSRESVQGAGVCRKTFPYYFAQRRGERRGRRGKFSGMFCHPARRPCACLRQANGFLRCMHHPYISQAEGAFNGAANQVEIETIDSGKIKAVVYVAI